MDETRWTRRVFLSRWLPKHNSFNSTVTSCCPCPPLHQVCWVDQQEWEGRWQGGTAASTDFAYVLLVKDFSSFCSHNFFWRMYSGFVSITSSGISLCMHPVMQNNTWLKPSVLISWRVHSFACELAHLRTAQNHRQMVPLCSFWAKVQLCRFKGMD